jgi:hypothetical protein
VGRDTQKDQKKGEAEGHSWCVYMSSLGLTPIANSNGGSPALSSHKAENSAAATTVHFCLGVPPVSQGCIHDHEDYRESGRHNKL